MEATSYSGHRDHGRPVVQAHDDKTGTSWPLLHIVRHSPMGFEWGYGGSGPADLARSLLADALGESARCPACQGRCRGKGRRRCSCCDDGWRALPYMDFKWSVVADWPQDRPWRITRLDILAWMAARHDVPPAYVLGVIMAQEQEAGR